MIDVPCLYVCNICNICNTPRVYIYISILSIMFSVCAVLFIFYSDFCLKITRDFPTCDNPLL